MKSNKDYRIVDTSVIIDGRIADICDTGFIEGNLIVPRFILDELQHIADSSDSMKRSRGRRGLDILNQMQKSVDINIEIVDQDFPK
jgi:Integral membrane protein (PIN domain superfamily)